MRLNVKNIFGAGLIALAFSVGTAKIAAAQSCTVPPTCDALGYTKTTTDCKDMSTLKCPFDQSKVFCVTAAEAGSLNCAVGDILYSDKTTNPNMVAGKIPIGVVFDPTNRLAIALNETTAYWSTDYFDIPDLPNYSSSTTAVSDWNGKNNTKTIIDYCKANSKSCPAAEYVSKYTSTGTAAGDWYLPGSGELNAIYGNKDALNVAIGKSGGTKLGTGYYWSSSEYDHSWAWYQRFSDGNVDYSNKNYSNYVRPVLAF